MGEMIKDELEFYSKFTRPLIINLPDSKDRVLAASWVKKIRNENSGTEKLRTDYLKLLLFALQRKKLVGIFADDPAIYEQLEEFPADFDLNDIAKRLIETEFADRTDKFNKQIRGQIGDYPPYTTDCSSDFREYVAAQDIPGFGVHCYYAISKEPVNEWQKSDKGIYPKMAKSAVDTSSPMPPGLTATSSEPTCVCPKPEGQKEADCKMKADAKADQKKKRQKKLGKTPPVEPLGTIPLPEDRTPPTWGSNLVEVKNLSYEEAVEEEFEEPPLDSFSPLEILSEASLFVEEFKKEAVGKTSPKRLSKGGPYKSDRRKKGAAPGMGPSAKGPRGALEDEDEELDEDLDAERSKREEDLVGDASIMDYLKEQITHSKEQKKIAAVITEELKESPALAGIPVTTPKASPSPTRPKSIKKLLRDEEIEPPEGDGEINVDDLDDEDLADMGLTREEAKKLFATDVFKLPGEEEFEDGLEKSDVSEVSILGTSPVADAEWDEWDTRMKAMEEEAERELQELADQGVDINISLQDDLGIAGTEEPQEFAAPAYFEEEEEMVEYGGHLISKANYDFLMSAEDLPRKPPEPAPEVAAAPPKAPPPKPGKPGKLRRPGKSGIAKPGQAKAAEIKPEAKLEVKPEAKPSKPGIKIGLPKPGKVKPGDAKPSLSKSKIQSPEAKAPPESKLPAPGTRIAKPASKLPAPGSKLRPPESKLKPPSEPKLEPPKVPVQKGSPEAASVLSEFEKIMKTREQASKIMEEVQPDYPPGAERTPPVFSKYKRVRKAAEGLVYAPEEFGVRQGEIQWKHGPEFFAGQTEFIPFDPRQQADVGVVFPTVQERQFGSEQFFDVQGEPDLFDEPQYLEEMDLSDTARRFRELELYSRLEDSLADMPCIPCGDYPGTPPEPPPCVSPMTAHDLPEPVTLAQLPPLPRASPTKPLPIKAAPVARQRTPPVPSKVPVSYSPGSAGRKYFTPPLPPGITKAPSPQRVPPPSRVLPPQRVSPPQMVPPPQKIPTLPAEKTVAPENVYTCEPISPQLEGLLERVTPDRILIAGLSETDATLFEESPAEIIEKTPPDNVFGIEGIESLDMSPVEYFEEDLDGMQVSPCLPCAKRVSQEVSPPERIKEAVGYSVAGGQALKEISPKFLEYKLPTKKAIKIDRQRVADQEKAFVDFLFADDKDMHTTVRRALEMISDIEQDEEDPYHLMPDMPPSPPAPFIEEGGASIAEEFLTYKQLTPPESRLPQLGKFSTPIPGVRPSGPPGAKIAQPQAEKEKSLRSRIAAPGTHVQRIVIGKVRPPTPGEPRTPTPGRSGIPAPGRPGTPAPFRLGTPEPGKLGIPAPGRPGTPAPFRLGTPEPGRLGIPAPARPGTPAPFRLGTPEPGRLGIPVPDRPGTPAPFRPGTPGTPEPGRPGIPVPGRPGTPAPFRRGIPGAPDRPGTPVPVRPGISGVRKYKLNIPQFKSAPPPKQVKPGTKLAPCGEPCSAGESRPVSDARPSGIAKFATRKQQSPASPRTPTAEDMRLEEFILRAPYRGPPGPPHFPQQSAVYEDYPAMTTDFKKAIQRHQIDQVFFEPYRPLLQSRNVLTGRTFGRRKRIERFSSGTMRPVVQPNQLVSDMHRRHYGIPEVPEEPPLPPRRYGVPGIKVPPRQKLPPAPTAWAPIPLPPDMVPSRPQPTARPASRLPPPGAQLRKPGPPMPGREPIQQMRPPGLKPPSRIKGTQMKAPPPQPITEPCPCEEYDMEELKKYGLTDDDLRPVNVNLDVSPVADLPEIAEEVEHVPDEIDDSFRRWEAQMKKLEEENAEDIALYGDLPAFQTDEFGRVIETETEGAPCPCSFDEPPPSQPIAKQPRVKPRSGIRPPSGIKPPGVRPPLAIKPPPGVRPPAERKMPPGIRAPSGIKPPAAKPAVATAPPQIMPPLVKARQLPELRPPSKRAVMPPPIQTSTPCVCATDEFDMEELQKYGVTAEDLRPINVDFEISPVSDISGLVEDEEEEEYVPDNIDDSFEKWEENLKKLEEENAEDIALYGHLPAYQLDEIDAIIDKFEGEQAEAEPPAVEVSVTTTAGGPKGYPVVVSLEKGPEMEPHALPAIGAPSEPTRWVRSEPMIPVEKIDEAIALMKRYGDMEPENMEFLLGADHSGGPMMPVRKIPDAKRLINVYGEMDPDQLLYMLDEEELVGKQTAKGFKPLGSKKIRYPAQIPADAPAEEPVPWWEEETPTPVRAPYVPPRRSPSPEMEGFAGFLRSPRPGPSRVERVEVMVYSPPSYDSPGIGALEESPPQLSGDELQVAGPKPAAARPSPPKVIVSQPPPCQSFMMPSETRVPSRQRIPREKLTRKKLDFDYSESFNIADEFIEDAMERYGEVSEEASPTRVPAQPLPQLPVWKTPEKIEKMVPRPKAPPPKPQYAVPEVQLHEYFERPPVTDYDKSVLVETPPQLEPSPPPISPRRMPPRRISPLPEVFGQTPPWYRSPDLASISPRRGERLADIVMETKISPLELTPPSPPSPHSTEQAMHQMVTKVRTSPGFGLFEGLRLRKGTYAYKPPLRPIRELTTQPAVGKMGLPVVAQIDMDTLGTGQQAEEPYVRSPYVPPPRRRSPVEEVSEEEEEVEEGGICDGICGEPVHPEKLHRVVATAPLPQLEQAYEPPPRRSPKLPMIPAKAPTIEEFSLSFEDIEEYDRFPTPPSRIPQVTPKPSPFLSPCASPGRTPPCQPILSPQLPSDDVEGPYITDYSGEMPYPESPEYNEEIGVAAAGEAGVAQEQDEMGLPNLVQLYGQHMPSIYASPTERRERQIITWEDQPQIVPVRSPVIRTGGDINVEALPVPEEQVRIDVPICQLEPFVPKTPVPPINLSPQLPQYEGAGLDEQLDVEALYAEEYGRYEEAPPRQPPPRQPPPRQPPPRQPSPRQPSSRTSPQMVQRWEQLLHESQAERFDTSPDYVPSPEHISPCIPCRSPARSPQVAVQQKARSPQTLARSQSPQLSRPRTPQAIAMPPQAVRPPSPQQPPAVRPQILQALPRPQVARPPSPMSPIMVPELSPLRLPQPSPPCRPCSREASPLVSPDRIVKQMATERRIVTVIPPRPSVPLEYEGEIVEPIDDPSKSYSDNEDGSFGWMDSIGSF